MKIERRCVCRTVLYEYKEVKEHAERRRGEEAVPERGCRRGGLARGTVSSEDDDHRSVTLDHILSCIVLALPKQFGTYFQPHQAQNQFHVGPGCDPKCEKGRV